MRHALLAILTIFVLALGTPIKAERVSIASVSECHSIESPLDRLTCYDNQTDRTVEETIQNDVGKQFIVNVETSKLKDTTDIRISVLSENAVMDKYAIRRKYKRLLFQCVENTTSWVLVTDNYMSDRYENKVIEYRIDNEKSKKKKLNTSTDGRHLGLSGSASISFIKTLFNKTTLVVRYIPYNESRKTVEFNIAGLEEVIKPLRNACNW